MMNYEELCSPENLFRAFDEFIRGKRKKKDVMQFQENLEENIFELSSELQSKMYHHGSYFRFHIWDPRFRIIHKALVRDRIVHHALFKYLYNIFNKTFIFHSYSSRLEKGTHLGMENVHKMMRKVSKNFSQESYALKCDIKSFFASISHEILLKIIQKNVRDEKVFDLVQSIVKSFHTHTHTHTHREDARGIPLGNLTSQIFANIYLNELDQFIKHQLKIRYYARYADDFVILGERKEILQGCINVIEKFLMSKLKISLHPRKTKIVKFRQGIDFLGYVLFPYHRTLRTKTKKRMFNRLNKKSSMGEWNASVQSYLGLLKHANTEKIQKEVFQTVPVKMKILNPAR